MMDDETTRKVRVDDDITDADGIRSDLLLLLQHSHSINSTTPNGENNVEERHDVAIEASIRATLERHSSLSDDDSSLSVEDLMMMTSDEEERRHHVTNGIINNNNQKSFMRHNNQRNNKTDTSSSSFTTKRYWAVVLYSITTILLYADQNLLSPNLTAIANEFGFTDLERDRKLGGDIAVAFFVLGAPASVLVGCWADTSSYRSAIFALVVGMGEGACLLTYFSTTYAQLYACRAVTGFSVGGALPLIYSVLGDLFAADERHAVNAIVGMGTGVGIAFGQGVAGFLGPSLGWRVPFLVISIPALLCAALVFCLVGDPERGASEKIWNDNTKRGTQQREDVNDKEEVNYSSTPRTTTATTSIHLITAANSREKLLGPSYSDDDDDVYDGEDHQQEENIGRLRRRIPRYGVTEMHQQSAQSSSSSCNLAAINHHHHHHGILSLDEDDTQDFDEEVASDDEKRMNSRSTRGQAIMIDDSVESYDEQDEDALLPQDSVMDVYVDSIYDYKGRFNRLLGFTRRFRHVRTFQQLIQTPTVILLLLQGAPGCLPWGIVNTYLNDYLAEDRGMSVEGATLVVLCFGIGTAGGLVLGGAGGRYLYQQNATYPSLLAGMMAMISCLPFWLVLNTVDASSNILYTIFLTTVAGLGAGGTGPIVKATLQNVTVPQARGQAFAVFNCADDFGRGLGPVFVANLIAQLDGDRRTAFNMGVTGWILCGLINLFTHWTVEQDEDRVQYTLLLLQQQQQQQQSDHENGRHDH